MDSRYMHNVKKPWISFKFQVDRPRLGQVYVGRKELWKGHYAIIMAFLRKANLFRWPSVLNFVSNN